MAEALDPLLHGGVDLCVFTHVGLGRHNFAADLFDQPDGLVEVGLGGQRVELGDGGHVLADVDADDFGALFRQADGVRPTLAPGRIR